MLAPPGQPLFRRNWRRDCRSFRMLRSDLSGFCVMFVLWQLAAPWTLPCQLYLAWKPDRAVWTNRIPFLHSRASRIRRGSTDAWADARAIALCRIMLWGIALGLSLYAGLCPQTLHHGRNGALSPREFRTSLPRQGIDTARPTAWSNTQTTVKILKRFRKNKANKGLRGSRVLDFTSVSISVGGLRGANLHLLSTSPANVTLQALH